MSNTKSKTPTVNVENVDPINVVPIDVKKANTKSKKSGKINGNNLVNKIKNPSNNFDNKMIEVDEIVASLDPKYGTLIKNKIKDITEKYDKLAIKLIEDYELEGTEDNEIKSKEKAEKLEELYNNRDIEILQVKLKYVEMSEKKEEIPEENEEINMLPVLEEPSLLNQEQNSNLYVNCLIHKKIIVPYKKLGNNMTEYFKNYSEKYIEGICHKEGYIRPFSSSIVNFSSGLLKSDKIIFDVVFSVDVCYPYENMELMCKIKNITKIGIRGIISENNNPIVLFISREHNSTVDFDNYEEGQYVKIKVIGNRFEENDKYISVIGEII